MASKLRAGMVDQPVDVIYVRVDDIEGCTHDDVRRVWVQNSPIQGSLVLHATALNHNKNSASALGWPVIGIQWPKDNPLDYNVPTAFVSWFVYGDSFSMAFPLSPLGGGDPDTSALYVQLYHGQIPIPNIPRPPPKVVDGTLQVLMISKE